MSLKNVAALPTDCNLRRTSNRAWCVSRGLRRRHRSGVYLRQSCSSRIQEDFRGTDRQLVHSGALACQPAESFSLQLLFVIAGLLRPGYSPISQAASDLGVGPGGAWVDATVVALATLKILLAIAFLILMRTGHGAGWRGVRPVHSAARRRQQSSPPYTHAANSLSSVPYTSGQETAEC